MKANYERAEQTLGLLTAGAIGLVVAGLVIGLGANIVADVRTDLQPSGFSVTNNSNGSLEYNVSTSSLDGLNALGGKLPSVGLILGAVVIIGILVAGFRGLR